MDGRRGEQPDAPRQPVARVAVDVPLPHLDRAFDYAVPEGLRSAVCVGCRVSVRFAGRTVSGFVLELDDQTGHEGPLQPLRRVVSSEPVLTPAVARLARTVADRYAGTLADVLRLAVPPRHARVEREAPAPPAATDGAPSAGSGAAASAGPAGTSPSGTGNVPPGRRPWRQVGGGGELLAALAAGRSLRTTWAALPGDDWAAALAEATARCALSGRGVLLCLPGRRDVARVDAALTAALGAGQHVTLTSDAGPAARYRAFLGCLRGQVRVVVGTRAAAFAPVHDPGLFVLWDDGDDLHAEPRAPYPHAREVLALRAHQEDAGLLVAGHARTAEVQQLVDSGWLAALVAPRDVVRAAWPRVRVTTREHGGTQRATLASSARLPPEVFDVLRSALRRGPVLLQVPRAGYRTRLECQDCRSPAVCPVCQGPLAQTGSGRAPTCGVCGRVEPAWRCPDCGGVRLRAPVVGERRTAEELGRAFPGVPVRRSAGDAVLADVAGAAAIVVSTPGAEPTASGSYAAAVLLDTPLALARPDLRAAEEAVRRWSAVAALVRPAAEGGVLLVVGDAAAPPVQALVRADPAGFAERELAHRRAARMPPATRLATVEGPWALLRPLADPDAVAAATGTGWPDPVELFGPVEVGPGLARLVVRVPWAAGPALAGTLARLQAAGSARKSAPLRVVVDPAVLG